MAHYAFLDKDNIVTEVIVGVDENKLIEGLTPEQWYGQFRGQKCIRTSYNGNIRKNYAHVGHFYDEIFDVFVAVKPFTNWKLNYETFKWEPPIPMPPVTDEHLWRWSEPNQEWIKVLIN
jgi:hypothetical protein